MATNYLEYYDTGTAMNCERIGHCLHEGTAIGSRYCCRCRQYIQTTEERIGFYEGNSAQTEVATLCS